ncbi:Zinc finger, DHHC-type, palmitoyltransferase [Kalmanozyma brasiliensis GHG001]|uniref:Zinc finger, DHHC-type, palmitoyltransferase n=1 Tax=Kalmanozyma brasiliensis (strain GHG001) TaxID=1365824 RepID=UPI002867B22E|nr:Zinc finger, DHHC-type, palmitoyltransferase [Kalmanozyma brasiliensis GHG001]KAF6766997.1 Zinc finger, DHHC-type, palmitoyltransferase [Kalmanozyma brasiliensis GHG001]
MSHTEGSEGSTQPHLLARPGSANPPFLRDASSHPSSRTVNSSSRLSQYTDAATRRSSFQSAQASVYQDTDTSLAFESANESAGELDLDSDLEVRRAPSRSSTVRSRTASPFHPSIRDSGNGDEMETTADAPGASSGDTVGSGLTRRISRQSVERPMSSLSRRSSASGNEDVQHRLRDAATAAASRSSMSARRHSTDELTSGLHRASTPHVDDDAAARSRPGSSLALRQDGGSFIKRDGARDRSSILPPAGFFAPKKPSARNSTSDLLSTSRPGGRSTTPLSFYANGQSGAVDGADAHGANGEVLRYRSTSPTGHEAQARAPSPWGLPAAERPRSPPVQEEVLYSDNGNSRRFSQAADGTAPLHPLDANDGFPTPSLHTTPQIGLRMMASTDPLLPSRTLSNVATTTADASHAGLGLDAEPPTPKSKQRIEEHRASQPSKTSLSTSKIDHPTPTATRKSAKPPRNYTTHKGDNHFLLSGLLMTSGDNPLPFILSFALLLALGGLFLGFESRWLSTNISAALPAVFGYIYLQSIVQMLVTAFRDPGVIPRNLDPDPPCTLNSTPFTPGRHALADPEDPLAVPVQRTLRIRGREVTSKWCETCGTYRPPRSSHCRVCDNCVENIDHHCTYLNTCVGRRNYVSFMAFLAFSILAALWVVGCTAARLTITSRAEGGFREALRKSPVSGVLFLLCIGVTGPLGVLFIYHIRLILRNRSTVEQIRINTAREYGQHKDVELGEHGDDLSVFGEDSRKGAGVVRALFERFGVLKPKGKDPNPFASRRVRTNVRNALGWRSVQLDSWLDRRGRRGVEVRERHPRSSKAGGGGRDRKE